MPKPTPIEKAIELAQLGLVARHTIGPAHVEFYIPCGGNCAGGHHEHTVTLKAGLVACDAQCPSRKVCYHILSSVGRPVAVAGWQMQRARTVEELRLIVEVHRVAIAALPQRLRDYANELREAAHNRLTAESAEAA